MRMRSRTLWRTWRTSHDHLGGEPAIWIGHDWGCVVVGELVAHQPERSRGVDADLAGVSTGWTRPAEQLSHWSTERSIRMKQYPDGQWDYYRYYTKHFETAVADLDADKAASLASIFRSGDPAAIGKVGAACGGHSQRRTLRQNAPRPADQT